MTAAHVQSYADRIAEAAAADGLPWTMSAFEAAMLGSRYGVWISTGKSGGYRLREVALEIAELLERKRR